MLGEDSISQNQRSVLDKISEMQKNQMILHKQ